ncbi:hypothetical protein RQM47_12025 [Rubrivirga sp. S365]|uniref:ZIP Zinc transporter n=1 Tax=Rubrivirga litoralis TaxID=3075598 RepID=A0ABU3BNH4_9BACT|nr:MULTISPECIES: hypothetical protein [unclassified Rubrivirga]MDT0630818.1 hypothetical protein [Rubrivirga sp. F394]MDT7857370.1 hypothetical protein [Rubrivirga sp. S365]
MIGLALVAALVLAGVHLVAARLRFLDGTPRSRWLSGAGGVSVAYVFVHLMPELAEGQSAASARSGGLFGMFEQEVYLLALAGLLVFYGAERLAKKSGGLHRGEGEAAGDEDAPSRAASASGNGTAGGAGFWVHLGSFALYNAIIGYLLVHREEPGALGLAVFAVAMALHFVVTDYGLRTDYQRSWERVGRWVLVASVLAGWALGAAFEVSELAIAGITAFLGGGVILNVLKEELPEERKSRFSALLLGAVAYAGLLLLL